MASNTCMTKPPKLTVKQKKFIEAYNGNGAEAARKAGYTDNNPRNYASELIRTNPYVKSEIVNRINADMKKTIADRLERQSFWTGLMRDETVDFNVRLKASEHLGKSEADFTDNIKLEQTVDISSALEAAHKRSIEHALTISEATTESNVNEIDLQPSITIEDLLK